jgi:pimeloyl-ACP methyl ester carboxylesterase
MGVPLLEVKRLVAVWRDKFDWRAAEASLNKLPHFTTPIEVEGHGTLTIHFVHAKSSVQGAIPMLLVHGWPGSFMEASKVLPLLTSGGGPVFDVVVPSLPGFGFSEASIRPDFGLEQVRSLGR